MSMSPYLLQKGRTGYRMGPATIEDAMLLDALICSMEHYHMGVTAENVAERFGIGRQAQDELAVLSHTRSCAAMKAGIFKPEIVPVEIKEKKGTVVFDTDEHPRPGTSLETLAPLKTVFKKDGTVTAGNASGVNDGAAAMVLMTERKAKDLGLKIMARVRSTVSVGVEPAVMGIGPAYAIPRALKNVGLTFADIGYWEVNEAFAAQFLGVEHLLAKEYGFKLNMNKVNRNGSGISLGHPVGCSGLRILVTLVHEMERSDAALGCASLCAGGGPAMAAVLELVN
jgi:acetyl-CoA C-acetyltransferase